MLYILTVYELLAYELTSHAMSLEGMPQKKKYGKMPLFHFDDASAASI